MKQFFQDYFYYTTNERNGVFILCILLLIIALLPRLFPFFIKNETVDFAGLEEKIAALNQILEQKNEKFTTYNQTDSKDKSQSITTFAFNPNKTSKADFMRLGLSEKTANIIINYRNKGGQFRKKEDFKKMYGLKSADYERLLPYIMLDKKQPNISEKYADIDHTPKGQLKIEAFEFNPNQTSKIDFMRLGLSEKIANIIINYRNKGGQFRKKEDFKKIYGLKSSDYERLIPFINIPTIASAKREIPQAYNKPILKSKKAAGYKNLKVAINQADVEMWKKLRGIGEGYANRIVKYRNLLGGYTNIHQLREVYGLPDSTFQHIKTYLVLDKTAIQQININTATAKELKKHPYFEWKHANAIVKFRQQHGSYEKIDDLQKIKIIPVDLIAKIKPYLTIN